MCRSLVLLVLFVSPVASMADGPAFEAQVRPILKVHCFQCHGEAGEKEGGLDLRLRRFIVRGGESGPAIVPESPE